MKENIKIGSFLTLIEVATISLIKRVELPEVAIDFFELMSSRFIYDNSYKPDNFYFYGKIVHENSDVTFFAQQTKTAFTTEMVIEQLTYFFDMRGSDKIGHGELRFNDTSTHPFFMNKPVVGYVETVKGLWKQGIGVRRLCMMNAYAQMVYGLPMYSCDTMAYSLSRFSWEKLFQQSMVEKITSSEGKHRYNFKAQ